MTKAKNEKAAKCSLYGVSVSVFLLTTLTILSNPDLCAAVQNGIADTNKGLYFGITHLHPLAYVVLFLIFLLAIANLMLQGWIPVDERFSAPIRRMLKIPENSRAQRRKSKTGDGSACPPSDEGIIGVKRSLNVDGRVTKPRILTPLDGVNHGLPNFAPNVGQMGAPRIISPENHHKNRAEFKFSSAVDVPSPEELERRGKEQIVVAGAVQSADGRGIASVIVYITDAAGNRLGQSCRSAAETGEYRVIVNEPGEYFLNGYKRGYLMENPRSIAIPIQSGKLEGFNFVMLPEGCSLDGKVISEETKLGIPYLKLKCICGTEGFVRETQTNNEGEFRIKGIQANSKCHIEIFGDSGNLLAFSESFETVQKKEIRAEIHISEDMPSTTAKALIQQYRNPATPPIKSAS